MSKNVKVRDAIDPVGQVVDTVKGFVGEAESLLRMTAEFSSDGVAAVKDEFEKKLKQVKRSVSDFEEASLRQARQAVATTDRYVHESPWSAIGIAMAFGALVGYLGHRPSAAKHR